jgi:superfamily II RNA helicase
MMDLLQALHKRDPVGVRRPRISEPSPGLQSPRRKIRLSRSNDVTPFLTDKRRISCEILLQKAQIPALRDRLRALTQECPADPLDVDYDGRARRIIEANREKEDLDARLAQLREHYTESHCESLELEIANLRAAVSRIKEGNRKLNQAIELKKSQIEAFLNQEVTVAISKQYSKISILEDHLREASRDYYAVQKQLDELDEQEIAELESRAAALSAAKMGRSRILFQSSVSSGPKRRRLLQQPIRATGRSKARRRMASDASIVRPSAHPIVEARTPPPRRVSFAGVVAERSSRREDHPIAQSSQSSPG